MDKYKEISETGPINVVADAAVMIVIEKLRKLRLTEEVSLCLALKGQADYVISKLKSVYKFLKDECRRESHSEWTHRLLRTIYDAEDKIDIFTYRIVRQEQQTIGIVPDVLMTIWWKCLFHIEMKRFIKQVDELLQDQHLDRDPNKSANDNNPPENPKQMISESQYYQRWQKVNAQGEDPTYIGSYRSKDYEKVIQQLLKAKPAELCGRAIYGDEGSGKTYLAGRAFNDFRIRKHFERRAWVHVTNILTLKDIRYEVLKQVKAPNRVLKNREHMDEEGVRQTLVEELGDKRYLVVLDDFSNNDTWYELIRYLPDWSKGSRVLVTTQSRYTAYVTTDYEDPIGLENLEEEGSKKLLQKKVKLEMPDLQDEDIHANEKCMSKCCEAVINRILEERTKLCSTAIYGDEGSDKTYLAKRVYNDSRIKNHFERRAWVHFTDSFTLKDIWYEVLKQVKAPDRVLKNREHMDEEGVRQTLVEELGDKRYLVVLDDFSNNDTWYELIRYLPDWSKGSHVLVTTQSRYTAYVTTDYEDPIGLENLREEGSLLQKKVKPEMPDLQDEDIHANEKYMSKCCEEVINRILEERTKLCSTAIYGDEGSDKTYLAERVYNDSRIKNHFERRAWVHFTDSFTLKDIWYEVLKQVKAPDRVLKNCEVMDEEGVRQTLVEELGDKRYLVVLDDFSNNDTWYELIRYLPDWSKGSRVLVTTRSEYTTYVTTDYGLPIRLGNLGSQKGSKKQLQEKVKPKMPDLQDDDIHAKILQASGGLPLTIGLLGGLLLDSSCERQLLQIKKVSLPNILTLSYNNLAQEEKPCFLYLTLFPKATPIPVRRILRLWLAEGLLMGSEKTSPEDLGVKYLEDLIMRNLVEVVSWKPDKTPWTCQVVTSVYDMFNTQAVDVGLLCIHKQKERDTDPSHKEPIGYKGPQFKVRWLAEHSNVKSIYQSDSYLIQHIRSFISFYTRKGILTKDLGTFLITVTSHSSFRLLRVLDLEGVYKPYLHDTIGRLVLLKYLGLRSTVLDALPNRVGCLPELETLDIKNTNITNLAESLWKSGCLRHLYLNGFHVDPKILRRSSRFLNNLRTLSGLYVGDISESLVSDLVAFVTNLTKLKIYYKSTEKLDSITRWISKLTNLHSLKLGIISGEKKEKSGNISGEKKEKSGNREKDSVQLPDLTYLPEHHHLFNLYLLGKLSKLDASQLPLCLRVFTLSMSELSDDPMPSLGKLPHLRTLRLLANSYIGAEMSCLTKGFPSLRVLKLWSLPKLQELTVDEGCMKSLKELEIRSCAELKFKSDIGLERLRSLKELILTKMPEASVADARKVKVPKDCLFFESGTIKPSKNQHDNLPTTQSPNKISHTEEKQAPSLTQTTQMNANHNEPSSVAPAATLIGQGGANPFTA